MRVPSYDWWADCLRALAAGEVPPACPERDVPLPGRYCWFRRDGTTVGVAIDPLDNGAGYRVQIGKAAPDNLTTTVQMEDFCDRPFGWFAENPVSSAEFVEWWETGRFPPEVAQRDKELRARRRARVDAQRRPRNPSASRSA